jgi:hypothetical protein
MLVYKSWPNITTDISATKTVHNFLHETTHENAATFKCNSHNAQMKFFRSLNSLLGELDSSPHIGITLFLVASNCYPILFYGLESMHLSKTNYSNLSYPCNSAYMKLF